ncbi:MAG: response regulator [Defluviitaleaceae bacterium]|nr:response regulator [Defluviitaleaceae bacterium]
MTIKESLQAIKEINLAGKVNLSNETQLSLYVKSLNLFIDAFPGYADKIRSEVSKEEYQALAHALSDVRNFLHTIHADELEKDCNAVADLVRKAGLASADQTKIEASAEKFLQNVTALSVEIQMALHSSHSPAPIHPVYTEPSPPATAASGLPVIMAVDNAIMYLNTLKKLLKDAPYELFCTSSCFEALEYLRANSPAVYLLDIEMPEMDGYELSRKIRQMGKKAPIIFITANSEREYVDRAVEEGAAGVLVKPLRLSQLLAKIKECVV